MPVSRSFFLLSPASTAGQRARLLFSPRAGFELAHRVQSSGGAPIGEVFSFLSGLYFRGKLAYARHFAGSADRVRIITSDRGLVSPDLIITADDLRAMAGSPIHSGNPGYRTPLLRDAERVAAALDRGMTAVLLGSIATGKYSDVLHTALAGRLQFPADFVGRGDMSRGGLLLRAIDAGEELAYVPVAGSILTGRRPPRLDPRPTPKKKERSG
jgi:hypothetical protein